MSSVHLLVLIHGMWGNPTHLAELARVIHETYPEESSDGIHLQTLAAETNQEDSTYDGIDWGGERVAQEILDRVQELEDSGHKVVKFSVTGYSLGGLVARYVIGILHQRQFFKNIAPVNFNTLATPHLGLPRYRSMMSSVFNALGPKLLSRTGEQFYCVDKWSAKGRPLLEVMADPERIFHQALAQFQHIRIYANSINDVTVPYVTAAIEIDDPFIGYASNGLEVEYHEEFAPVVKSYKFLPAPPTLPKSDWYQHIKNKRLPLPPRLQFPFPYNIVIYAFSPVLLPTLISLVVTKLYLDSRSSRARIRLLERDFSAGKSLAQIMDELEEELAQKQVEEGSVSEPAQPKQLGTPEQPEQLDLQTYQENDSDSAEMLDPTKPLEEVKQSDEAKRCQSRREQPVLSEVQKAMAKNLNKLPLKKELAFVDKVVNAHAIIVCRDIKRFEIHKRGEGVVRHWATSFIL